MPEALHPEIKTGAEIDFDQVVKACSMAGEFKKLDDPRQKALRQTFFDLVKLIGAETLDARAKLLADIVNSDKKASEAMIRGDSYLRDNSDKPKTMAAGA